MPDDSNTNPQVLPARHRRGRRRNRGGHRASIVKAEIQPATKRENLEEAAAIVKIVGEYAKTVFESPGVAAFFQGYGQAAAARSEGLTQGQAQNHEHRMLLAKQFHERQLQLDRMQEEATRRREARRVRVWFAGVLLAIGCAAFVLLSLKRGWIDEKAVAAISTAVSIFCAVIMRMNSTKTNGSTASAPPAVPPVALPPPAQKP